ncbi:hypothetical protein [Fructilactobacillus frigidiflavus]
MKQHLMLGIRYLRDVARKLREKVQAELLEMKKRLEKKEKELNERSEKLDKRAETLNAQATQVKNDQRALKNASSQKLKEINRRNTRDYGPSL